NVLGLLVLLHAAIGDAEIQVSIRRCPLVKLSREDINRPDILASLYRLPRFINLCKRDSCMDQEQEAEGNTLHLGPRRWIIISHYEKPRMFSLNHVRSHSCFRLRR